MLYERQIYFPLIKMIFTSFQLKDMEQGDKCMYCDLCSQRKRVKGDTVNGIKKSMVCHLAIQHCELRPIMEKDTRLSKEFIKTVSKIITIPLSN